MMVPAVFLLTQPALAQDTAAEVEAEIDKAWRELEPIIEEHNAVRGKLKDKRKAAEELAEKIEPLELRVDVAQAAITDVAVYSFKGGNMSAFRALLTTGSPLALTDQLATLDQLARAQSLKITKVLETKAEYEAEKAELDKLVDELATMESELAERAEEIDAEIDRLKDMRDELLEEEAVADTGNGGDCPASYPGGGAESAVTFACAQIGKPYGWGEAGPGAYDCSGLTMAAWNQGGVSLPHNAAEQRSSIPYVERSNLRPGDLVFYYSDLSHVGMYAGAGWVVHASNPSDPVHMAPIDEMPIHSYGRPGG
ncbi:MAG: glycoside hydrolase [Micromonosporaceae bacterium]|nr:glycoside hydrolase [Micromonosporaceae bacterium]